MNWLRKFVLLICVSAVICIAVFASVYYRRFRTISTIEKDSNYEDGYDLYSITIDYDYSVQDIIDSGFSDTQSFVNAVIKEAIPLLPVNIEIPSFGCSAFRAVSDKGETLMGRNYDFKLNTSAMMVRCNPKNGYRSIAFAALNNINADHPLKSFSKKFATLTAPFICLDGVNEKGVSISVLTLDSEPTVQQNGREKITASLAIRMVLDQAATTQEAIDLLNRYDMLAVNGRDYHLFISDASGDSRVVEYDCEDPARPLVDTPMPAITNFYALYFDKVQPNQKNGIYGHGKERYDAMMEIIVANNGVLSHENAWAALRAASTEPNPENVTSNTQWSILFNNSVPSAEIVLRRNWAESYSFDLP